MTPWCKIQNYFLYVQSSTYWARPLHQVWYWSSEGVKRYWADNNWSTDRPTDLPTDRPTYQPTNRLTDSCKTICPLFQGGHKNCIISNQTSLTAREKSYLKSGNILFQTITFRLEYWEFLVSNYKWEGDERRGGVLVMHNNYNCHILSLVLLRIFLLVSWIIIKTTLKNKRIKYEN